MIDREKLALILTDYKRDFPGRWKDAELFKWEAVQHFQTHWDPKAEDFASMFKEATSVADSLLGSGYAYPKAMICNFAQADAAAVRAMFADLYDETKDLGRRVQAFRDTAEELRSRYDDGTWRQHYQNTNYISIYLWLRYPDTYFFYKYDEYRQVAKALDSDNIPKKDGSVRSMVTGFAMYDELRTVLLADPEIRTMLDKVLTKNCYPDTSLRTMTLDLGFYISLRQKQQKKAEAEEPWFPADYTPGLSVADWLELLDDPEVFNSNARTIMRRMLDYGGQATCTQLAVKYGGSKNYYNNGSVALAKRVANKMHCPLMPRDDENSRYWPVLYRGRKAEKEVDGSYIWRLRDELKQALEQTDLSNVPLYADRTPAIWKISHGTAATGIPDSAKEELLRRQAIAVHADTRAKGVSKLPQGDAFIMNMKKGDFFYLCYGSRIQLLGQVTSDDAAESETVGEGWYERPYQLIAVSKDTSPYSGEDKWWTPNDNSTCIQVPESEYPLFESCILAPYFGMTVAQLLNRGQPDGQHWWLTANPTYWTFSNLAVGERTSYSLLNEQGNPRHIQRNFLNAKAGDPVVCYEARPVFKVVALGRIVQENDGKNIWFEKTEKLESPVDLKTLQGQTALEQMEFFAQPQGSLFKLTPSEYDCIMNIIRSKNPADADEEEAAETYTKEDFLREVYMDGARYETLVRLLRNKMNIILQGAPGVGKTFTARRLAWSVMGERDDLRIELVQFHQNYSYEDFVMGYRPDGAGFRLVPGIFYQFCERAASCPDKDFFFIIDEINRGNISKIFGELLMLIEKDYRGTSAKLVYDGKAFTVPKNVYIIGMMNTADRSLALIDYALRRRFGFFAMEPGFHTEGFQKYQRGLADDTLDALIETVQRLNHEIAEDDSLGPGFCIGHSYFCGRKEDGIDEDWLRSVVEFDIIPTLQEYWFDARRTFDTWAKELRSVFDDG